MDGRVRREALVAIYSSRLNKPEPKRVSSGQKLQNKDTKVKHNTPGTEYKDCRISQARSSKCIVGMPKVAEGNI